MSHASYPPRTIARFIAWAALTLFVISFLILLSQQTLPKGGAPTLWPINAILAGLLLRFQVLRNVVFWIAVYAGPTLIRYFLGTSWNLASLYSLIDLSGILAIQYILTSQWAPKNLRSPQAVGRFLLASATAAAMYTSIALALLPWVQRPGSLTSVTANLLFSQLLSYCIFLPPILLLPRPGSRLTDQFPLWRRWRKHLQQPRTLLPLVTLVASIWLCFLLGGLGAIIFTLPALLYCAWTYRQQNSVWLTAGTAGLLILGMTQGWILSYLPSSASQAASWANTSLRLGVLLLVTAPLLLSGIIAAHREQISTLTLALDHDALTKALSRTAFFHYSQAYLRNTPTQLGMLMLDLDHFKYLNDRHSHAAGDQALREFSSCIHSAIRPGDLFGRVGGEEFGITLPDTSLQSSIDIAERLRAHIEALLIRLPDGTSLFITVSIGIAHTSQSPHDNPEKLLSYADQALYQAKRNGRNQISVHQDDSLPAEPPEACAPATNRIPMTAFADFSPLIAILEDDPAQSAWLQQTLLPAGFSCKTFDNGSDLLNALRTSGTAFQLLLLDWELPGINGMEVLRWVRANLSGDLPVIFVTSRTLESDLVEGLDAGANDYLCKPYRPAELLARIRALLRPHQIYASPDASFQLRGFSVDTSAREIQLRGKAIQMTPKEFDLAALFLRHPWRLFSRDDLSALVWNREIPSTSRTLDTHLSNIRKKLQLGPASGTLLSASYTLGYRLELLDDDQQAIA